jgi:hypothetical protein
LFGPPFGNCLGIFQGFNNIPGNTSGCRDAGHCDLGWDENIDAAQTNDKQDQNNQQNSFHKSTVTKTGN